MPLLRFSTPDVAVWFLSVVLRYAVRVQERQTAVWGIARLLAMKGRSLKMLTRQEIK